MFTEKTWERLAQYGDNLLTALLVLAAGLLLTKLVLKVAHKVLDKSSLDESVYKFLLKTIKYGLYLLIFVVVLTCLHVPTGTAGYGARRLRRGDCAGAERQSRQYRERYYYFS